MAGDMNKVILVGRLGADPEGKALKNGSRVVNLRIATGESWKDKTTGEKKEKVEWHRVTIWNEGLGKIAEQYLKKGSKVLIEGQLQTRKWEKDGVDHYSTEVVLQGFQSELLLLGDAGGNSGGGAGEQRRSAVLEGKEPVGGGAGGQRDMDNKIPF